MGPPQVDLLAPQPTYVAVGKFALGMLKDITKNLVEKDPELLARIKESEPWLFDAVTSARDSKTMPHTGGGQIETLAVEEQAVTTHKQRSNSHLSVEKQLAVWKQSSATLKRYACYGKHLAAIDIGFHRASEKIPRSGRQQVFMSSYKKVAIAGATGNLGPSLVNALLDAGFEVTVLTRVGGSKPPSLPQGVSKVIPIDYTSVSSLTSALQGQDVFVSNIPNHGDQKPLIDAAIAADVKRFLPSEFGMDVMRDVKTAALPAFKDGKKVIQEYLKEKGDKITWTCVVTGLFLDWCLDVGFSVDLKGTTRVIDDGNKKASTTLLSDIGKAVVGVLQHPEETKNRAVYVQSASLSQNDLLEIAKKVKPGFSPKIQQTSTAQFEYDAYAKLKKGEDVDNAMMDFVFESVFGEGFASDWSGETDNALLGIKELSEPELEEVVKRYVP
ncbi:hypothetical protein PRZ48_011333 [Zasmidium cellare]|uniref:NmrA-like domain-containing protein n=1 Tax=Zasmidium cellare TaxID=395010 RepID=A0ABR0E642_ZASCE|nr:hypothetical protein PRZ48_011333 [Zasmidium cellare]